MKLGCLRAPSLAMAFQVAGMAQAAAVEVELFELDARRDRVGVAILGGPEFDPKDVILRTLAFGWTGAGGGHVPATVRGKRGGFTSRWQARESRDVNGDDYADRIVWFRPSERAFAALLRGDVAQFELRGITNDGGTFYEPFVAQATVSVGDAASACSATESQQGVTIGMRCFYDTAAGNKPIDIATLVSEVNNALAADGLEITAESAVVVEAYGGKGLGGNNLSDICGTAKGGAAGAGGYALTILTVNDLPANLYIYPGENSSGHGGGGAGTVVAGTDLSGLADGELSTTDAATAVDAGIMLIAGGGGGGGRGNSTNAGWDCHDGGNGGDGGVAIANLLDIVVGTGADGTKGDPGAGGQGAGGAGHPAGSDGVGGPGGLNPNAAVSNANSSGTGGQDLWVGWSTDDNASYDAGNWKHGAGGWNQQSGGAGGGGFGGGGSSKGEDAHKGGGGGGGSLAMLATVQQVANALLYGQEHDSEEVDQLMVVTFASQQITD